MNERQFIARRREHIVPLILSLCAVKLLKVVLQLTDVLHAGLALFALHDDWDPIAIF